MEHKYSNIEELRKKKELLKKEISEIEDLLTFENTKESLSVFTNGFTDKYLQEELQPSGEKKTMLKTNEIVKEVSNTVKDTILSKNSVYGFAKSDAGISVIENALKIGAVSFVGNYAKKSLYNSNWKKKIIGVALIYVAPIALRYVQKKLIEYQRNKTTSSIEKLI